MKSIILAEQMTFSDMSVWQFLLQIFILCTALAIGNVIQRSIPFMRKSLIPTAIIGGFVILIFKAIFHYGFNIDIINNTLMEKLTYHCLGIGFIALSLKNTNKDNRLTKTKVFETGATTIGTYLVQGTLGLGSGVLIYLFIRFGVNNLGFVDNGFKWFGGALLPLGFGQGTGQALSWGNIYETSNGFVGGKSFGLAIATVGFVVASIVGVIYLNVLKRKGIISINEIEHRDNNILSDYQSENDIPNSDSIDKLSVQISIVLFIYAITFAFLYLVQTFLIDTNILGNFGFKTLSPLLWGFNYLFGVIFAFIFKAILTKLKRKNVVKREYISNYLLDRFGGFLFDIMVVAGTAAIDFDALSTLYIPLIIICTLGTIGTFIFLKVASKEIFKGYENEGFLALFGMLTGTTSNGMILLREIDPKYETPMANNLVLQNLPSICLGLPFLLLIGFAASSLTNAIITLVLEVLYFILLVMFIFRKKIFKKSLMKKGRKQ